MYFELVFWVLKINLCLKCDYIASQRRQLTDTEQRCYIFSGGEPCWFVPGTLVETSSVFGASDIYFFIANVILEYFCGSCVIVTCLWRNEKSMCYSNFYCYYPLEWVNVDYEFTTLRMWMCNDVRFSVISLNFFCNYEGIVN